MTDRLLSLANDRLNQTEAELKIFRKRSEELKDFSDTVLRVSSRKNGKMSYYYLQQSGKGERSYLGRDDNETVRSVREARYCKEFIDKAEKNASLLRSLISGYRKTDYDTINNDLPRAYRGAELSFSSDTDSSRQVMEWKRRKEADKKRLVERYPQNLKHKCMDGTIVRSKSEVIIADMLFMSGIPYVYEYPYFLDDDFYKLDFTALSTIDYETEIIIEHQGMMDVPAYREKYLNTLTACLRAGIVPNVNIFFTFDDMRGNFDASQVWDIIKFRLKP